MNDGHNPSAQVNEQQKVKFLELIAQGHSTAVAARAAGSTGTKFRALRNPDAVNYEEGFNERFRSALELGKEAYKDKLRQEVRERAFDRDDPASASFLKMEAEALLEEYEHRRKKQLTVGQDSPFQIQAVLPMVSQEVLDAMPVEELEELIQKLRRLAGQEEPPPLQLVQGE